MNKYSESHGLTLAVGTCEETDDIESTFSIGATISWSGVDVKTTDGSKSSESLLLNNVSGAARSSQITAILGASGAGKTTLLSALTGRLGSGVSSSGVVMSKGEVTLDSRTIDPTSMEAKKWMSHVDHSDTLLATSTPHEALRFSAKLRLPSSIAADDINNIVTKMLKLLRLEDVADSRIGGTHVRGLSSGEKRRVSLGVELVVRPKMLFLDEITSGLDSYNALNVMRVLKDVVEKEGTTVLMTVHQPSTEVFNMIDNVILLNHGQCLYSGSSQALASYFSDHGYPIPVNYNPADWILHVSQNLGEAEMESFVSASFVNKGSEELSSEDTAERILDYYDNETISFQVRWTMELYQQLKREFSNFVRDGHALKLRFLIIICGSSLAAILFQGIARTESIESIEHFTSYVGAVFFLILMTMITLQVTVLDFVEQRPLFCHEYQRGHYGLISYGITKMLTEAVNTFLLILTFVVIVYWSLGLQGRFWYLVGMLFVFNMTLGAIGVALASYARDPRSAKEMIPVLILPQVLLCGFFVTIENIPSWLQWSQWLMPLTYAFRLILAEEFASCVPNNVSEGRHVTKCLQVIQTMLSNSDLTEESVFNETSTLRLIQTGEYIGYKDIVEYLGFLLAENPNSPFWNSCAIEEGPSAVAVKVDVASLNSGICDITLTETYQGYLNPTFATPKAIDTPFMQWISGQKLKYVFNKDEDGGDDGGITLLTQASYLPVGFTESHVATMVNETATAVQICETLQGSCPESYVRDSYVNFDDCVERMLSLPLQTYNERGVLVSDSNSTGCRIIHASLAAVDPYHCPHVSFYEEEDAKGKIKCSEGNNFAFEDFYTDNDLALFASLAEKNDWDPVQQINGPLAEDDAGTCRQSYANTSPELFDITITGSSSTSRSIDANSLYCASYLDIQNATGEHTVEYWFALVGIFVAVRVLGLVALRRNVVC